MPQNSTTLHFYLKQNFSPIRLAPNMSVNNTEMYAALYPRTGSAKVNAYIAITDTNARHARPFLSLRRNRNAHSAAMSSVVNMNFYQKSAEEKSYTFTVLRRDIWQDRRKNSSFANG